MQHIRLTNAERGGVNAISSLMGHLEAVGGPTPDRFRSAADAVLNLPPEGLLAAEHHLQLCQEALTGDDLVDPATPLVHSELYRQSRQLAIWIASGIVCFEQIRRCKS